jgi:hypothetical protein
MVMDTEMLHALINISTGILSQWAKMAGDKPKPFLPYALFLTSFVVIH